MIQKEGKIYSACEDGKVVVISTTDIAAVAFRALTDESTQYRLRPWGYRTTDS